MASYRNISMDFWTDSKVVDDFTPEDRYIYLYCMTNPHTNLCGCYEVSIKQIANETGYNNDSVERLLKRLDSAHNVIRYSAQTKELLILNWCRYNWSTSEKLNKPLLGEIRKVKNDRFREYLAARYNERSTVTAQYNAAEDGHPEVPRHKHGAHGWVRLTEEEYARLIDDLGEEELTRCIDYIDESAQMHGNKNKWRDWNLVIRKCSRERWGIRGGNGSRPSTSGSAMDDLQQLHQMYASEETAASAQMTGKLENPATTAPVRLLEVEMTEAEQVTWAEDRPARAARYVNIEMTDEELAELAAVVFLEAGNQSAEGQQAVVEVVFNRVLHFAFPDTVHDVLHQGEGGNVPQFSTIYAVGTATPTQAQYDAINGALYGDTILDADVVFFSRNGENDRVWGQIGDHVFCREYIWR